jgi:hypothetical protein
LVLLVPLVLCVYDVLAINEMMASFWLNLASALLLL